jgi:hypothetical protein
VSADSIYGQTLGGTIATWPASEDLGLALTTLYSSIHETAAQGLVASVRNETAYRTAARAMLRLLTGLPAIDKSVQAIVAADGFSSGDPSPAP